MAVKSEPSSRAPGAHAPKAAAGAVPLAGADGQAAEEQALKDLLSGLRAARDGDFSVRLNARRRGLIGEIAAEFNELASTNQRMAQELVRVGRIIGREGRMTERAALPATPAARGRRLDRVGQRADRRPRAPDDRGRARHRRRRRGRPVPEDGAEDRGPAGQGRVPAHRHHGEHDGRPARRPSPTRSPASRARSAPTASSAARPRSRASAGTWKDLTESVNSMASNLTDQVRNIAAGHDRGGQGRPDPEDHRRRQGRDPRAQEHHQHDGRPALVASPTRSRASRARSAPRASSAARPRSRASAAPGAT